MVAILAFGLYSAGKLRTSFFPENKPSKIKISVVYPGTSPVEIEETLITKIEDEVEGVEGIDRSHSQIRENSGSITLTLADGADIDEVQNEVKSAVDRVTPWPEGAESPRIIKDQFSMPAIVVAISSGMDLWTLKSFASELETELKQNPSISSAKISGLKGREIAIQVAEDDLLRYGLTFEQIALAIRASNRDLSGGKLKTTHEEMMIRAYQKDVSTKHIENIVVKALPDGNVIRVKDLSAVTEQFGDCPTSSRYNGEEALYLVVDQRANEDLLQIADHAKETIIKFKELHPDLTVDIVFDSTVNLRDRIEMLKSNGIIGLLLVLITLTLFLNFRIAFWVALGIPVSFAGMFLVAQTADITINVLSLFGMIVVVGILVDDAIVVAEQTFQGIEKVSLHMTDFWL